MSETSAEVREVVPEALEALASSRRGVPGGDVDSADATIFAATGWNLFRSLVNTENRLKCTARNLADKRIIKALAL